MVKRALLVGCNYGALPEAYHLKGCANDVATWKDVLESVYGFEPACVEVMVDTDPNGMQPTGKNIKDALRRLVAECKAGDVLFFHFSGHGTQLEDDEGDEETDAKDEALFPCDGNVIVDDDIREILGPMDPGCKFTFSADCCHSGGMLDHETIAISGSKDDDDVKYPTGLDTRDRFISFSAVVAVVQSYVLTKVVEVATYKIRDLLYKAFGADATNAIGKVARSQIAEKAPTIAAAMPSPAAVAAKPPPASKTRGLPADKIIEYVKPGVKPPPEKRNNPNKGILLTGCQSDEKSADVADGSLAYGAFTHYLATVIKDHHAKHPGQAITYRQAVLATRKLLKGKFPQNPCLECSEANADSPFILH